MQCSKYSRNCDYISKDNDFIFVLMPFHKDFDNVFDALQTAVKEIPTIKYKCTRADQNFTNHSIWCENICKPIHKAKYLIVDITGRNPNVFYELGFSHAIENTEAIIITQKIEDAPFDIKDLGLIIYSPSELKDLREKIKNAIIVLDKKKELIEYTPKTSDEIIADLKQQLRDEETRSSNFKKERKESEDREQKLKDKINEIEAIKSNPNEEAIKRIGELESSIAEYKSKLKYTEDDKKDLIAQLQTKLKEKEDKLKNLEQEFEKSIQSNDNSVLSELLMDESIEEAVAIKWFNKAYYSEDINESIEYYRKVIDIKPDYNEAWYNMGLAYYDKEDYDKATECFQKAINIKPDDHEAWNNIGSSYYEKGDNDKAIECYRKAINIKLDKHEAWNNIGNVYVDKGDYDQAIECYQKAIDIKPDYYEAWNNIGIIYKNKGDNDKAIECYQKAIDIKSDNNDAWFNIGLAYGNKGNYDKAIECYLKAIDIKPDYNKAWNNLGFLYIKLGESKEAEEAINKAISSGNNIYAFTNLGHIFLIKKDEENAIKNYKISLKNFDTPEDFFKSFDDDFQYLIQYGITKEKYTEIRKLLEAFSNSSSK